MTFNMFLIVGILLGAAILKCGFTVIYRLLFHPLSRFPGPWLAKISDIYPAWYSLKGDLHLKIYQAHQKYGRMVRMGPNKLSVNSVAGLQEIYRKNHVQKSKAYEVMLPAPGAYNTHTCIDKALHRRKRRIVGQAFSEQAVRAFEPTVVKNIDIFIGQLLSHCQVDADVGGWSKPVDMSTLTMRLALDVMGEFGFGRTFETQTKETNRGLIRAVEAASRFIGAYAQYPRFKNIGLERWLRKGSWTRAKFEDMVERRIAEKDNQSHDLFSFIVDAKDPETGQGFTLDEIWAESGLFIVAGSNTTSTSMAATLFYLSRYLSCKEKLTASIRETFSSVDEICSGPKLTSCHYLRACIDEAMRMSPPTATALWREVCKEGITIDGEYIPSGVEVGSSLYSIHHIEDVFSDPWTYNPDRWLVSGTGISEERNDAQRLAFNPFSLGTRKCIAQTMAYTEISITLAKTLWFFDFRVPVGPLATVGAGTEGDRNGRHRIDEFQFREHIVSHHEGPYLEFSLRRKT